MKYKVFNFGMAFVIFINYSAVAFFLIILLNSLVKGIAFTLLIFIILLSIAVTPLGDWYYRKIIFNLREPNEKEKAYLNRIYLEVYRKARKLYPRLSDKVKILVYDNSVPNAFAIGSRTIAVHTGLINGYFLEDEIKAIIAHEFAHIINGDSACSILVFQSNVLVNIVRIIIKISLWFMAQACAAFTVFMILLASNNDDNGKNALSWGELVHSLMKLFNTLVDKVSTWIIYGLIMIAMDERRKHEYLADAFSTYLGYGDGAKMFLAEIDDGDFEQNKYTMAYLLNATHPPIEERIKNINRVQTHLKNKARLKKNSQVR